MAQQQIEPDSKRWQELTARFNGAPYAQELGMKVVGLDHGYAKVALPMRPAFNNWTGRAHGGLIMTLADHAFSCATNTLDGLYLAVQFNTNFIATPAVDGTVFAEARVVHSGRTLAVGEIVVYDSTERVIARATGTVVAYNEQERSAGK